MQVRGRSGGREASGMRRVHVLGTKGGREEGGGEEGEEGKEKL